MKNNEVKLYEKTSWLQRTIIKGMQYILITVLIIASVYGIWGWITLNDIRQYCTDNNIEFEKVIIDCLPDLPKFSYSKGEKDGYQFSTLPQGSQKKEHHELARYFIPFVSLQVNEKEGPKLTVGSVLAPFLFVTENASNAIFCLALGYAMSLLLVAIRFVREGQITFRILLMRPLIGSLSSLVLFVIILSGGKLIWTETTGISGISLGVISAVASFYCEKIKFLSTVTL